MAGQTGNSVAGYNIAYTNTVYKFKYTQQRDTSGYGGFYLSILEPNNIPWGSRGILITSGKTMAIQGFAVPSTEAPAVIVQENTTDMFVTGKTYDVEFGMHDIRETEVRIILRDGNKEIFNIVSDSAYFHSKPVCFGIYCSREVTTTISGIQAVEA